MALKGPWHTDYYNYFNLQKLGLKNFSSLVLFDNTGLPPVVNILKICIIQKLDVMILFQI